MAAKKTTKKKPAKKAVAKKVVAKKAVAKKAVAKKATPQPPAKKAGGARVVHWEIQSKMPTELHDFYRDVFAWKIDANNAMNYGMVASGGNGGINGGIGGSMHEGSSVVVYVGVPDINASLQLVHAAGGTTVMPRTDVGPVIMALFVDPEGNTMGLVEV